MKPRPLRLLDEYRDPDSDVRIDVDWLLPCQAVDEQYVQPARSIRLVLSYLRRVGPIAVIHKIRSRLAERDRNSKAACIGFGRVIEAPARSVASVGRRVLFYAPSINPTATRAVLDAALIHRVDTLLSRPAALALPPALKKLAGWSRYSGIELPASAIADALRGTADQIGIVPGAAPVESIVVGPISERVTDPRFKPTRPTAAIFGLGHYAKHVIVPNLPRDFDIAAVHEIDPDQLASWQRGTYHRDTAPMPRDDENYDLWLIAGYHHTHTPIALTALERGGAVAIEKPIATTRDQIAQLQSALAANPDARLFACFQRRYARYNDWLREDLRIEGGIPVHYDCISYDISLSPLHWYCWPTARSRMISNGCHWIDHFMLLNDYSPVVEQEAVSGAGQNCLAWLRLANGAELSLRLTEIGGSPFGVRDHVEVSVPGRTATIRNSAQYESFDSPRVLRRATVNPVQAYQAMYREIGRRVLAGLPGDTPESLRSSAAGVELDVLLERQGTVEERDIRNNGRAAIRA